MKTLQLLLFSLLLCGTASAAVPSSINNDDSCDVKVGPAATLLLPYFEVDTEGTSGQTTLFTITNVTRYPQIAHVTLWSDWAYPMMTFNVFLTGYDVQAINLADILIRGIIAPPSGTSSATKPGTLSASTNPNIRSPLDCGNIPGSVPASIIAAVREAFTIGVLNFGPGTGACSTVGGVHADAIGYATIDVVASCTTRMPSDPNYYTTDLLFDNVLVGDYQQIGAGPAGTGLRGTGAVGSPMVHIRAVPEGGGAGSNVGTSLPYTFYDRYTPSATRTIDRRQPLPSTFAARFIQGGTNAFATDLTIWREGFTGSGASCASHANNSSMTFGEIVRFDEHENAFAQACSSSASPVEPCTRSLPATSSTNWQSDVYPFLNGTDVGGWLYLNLNNGGSLTYSVTKDIGGVPGPTSARTSLAPIGSTTTFGPRPSQNWVTVTMFGNLGGNHMVAEFDAASLGNGCTPAAFRATADPAPAFNSGVLDSAVPVGPAGGVFVCPPGTTLTDGTTTLCTGTNVNPIP
ncbi:MAG TPA: hypothetical protein VLC46_17105 [Thermoanaerobaculia bacterium]|jgi:hypothetical protein|nr:hypothetical protein [Thermoanaerobaculia bacterium]